MRGPLVSVVIPAHNEEKYIENTLKSVLNQDYKKLEVIVVNDNSNDSTAKLAKMHADKVLNIKAKNPCTARNKGADASKGDILIFLDADTLMAKNLVSQTVKTLTNGHVGSGYPILPLSDDLKLKLGYMAYNKFMHATIKLNEAAIPGICGGWRQEVFEKVGGYDEGIKFFGDVHLSSRINKLGKIAFLKDTFVLTSPRRVQQWGFSNAMLKYFIGFIKYYAMRNDFSESEYKPVR